MAVPRSKGNIVIDPKKCAGCLSCMLACTVVHSGVENMSLARLQISQNVFGTYPGDIKVSACRQCPRPLCVEACPTEPKACHVDTEYDNIRVIDQNLCIGCRKCVEACPFTPQMPIWDEGAKKASKCHLCLDTPFWSEKGGFGGKQACVEVCPMKAVSLVDKSILKEEKERKEVAR
jgi:protein NrfC